MASVRQCPWWIAFLSLALLSSQPMGVAMTFSLRAAAVLSKQPSYKSSDRLELDPAQVLVVGPALEQVDGFCHYDLRNRQGKSISPKTAWTPCHNIDRLVLP